MPVYGQKNSFALVFKNTASQLSQGNEFFGLALFTLFGLVNGDILCVYDVCVGGSVH